MLDHGTTGDGVLTGLMLAARVAETGRSLAELAAVMTRLPQVLVNVRGVDTSRWSTRDEALLEDVAKAADELDGAGRVLLRKSGHRAARPGDGGGGRRVAGAGGRRAARELGPDASRPEVTRAMTETSVGP